MSGIKQIFIIGLIIAGCFLLLLGNFGDTRFSASVIDLLQGDDVETLILRELADEAQGKELTVRMYSGSGNISEAAVNNFKAFLDNDPAIKKSWRTGQRGMQDIASVLFNDRNFWLLPGWMDRHFPDLATGSEINSSMLAEKVVRNLDNYLESPDAMMLVDIIPRDPFLLMDGLEDRLPASSESNRNDEVFLWVEQKHSPFSTEGQEVVFTALSEALRSAQSHQPDLQMEYTGVSVFASASKAGIKGEIQRLNLLGIGIVFLISILAIRSFDAILRITAVILIALLVAATAVVTVFESVHIIALVIGSILTGIAVDYGFHLILSEKNCIPDSDTRKAVIGGSLSSALGFLVLMGAPLPFLRQVGVFVGAGLIAAVIAAMLLRSNRARSQAHAWNFRPNKLPPWTGLVLCVLFLPGLLMLNWESNIRDLEYPLPELKEKDERIQNASSAIDVPFAYLVYSDDILSARQMLQRVDPRDQLIHAGTVLPELQEILDTQRLMQSLPDFPGAFGKALEERDYYPDAFADFLNDWESYLSVPVSEKLYREKLEMFSDNLPGPLKNLVHIGDDVSWFMVLSDETLPDSPDSQVILLDQSNMLSNAFSEYGRVMWLFSIVCLASLILAVCLYFGIWPGLEALAVPAIAGIFSFGIIGLWQQQVGLFHLVGALLAFCISLDYGLFAVTSRRAGRKLPKSITISSITTLAVFGVLATSEVSAVRQLATTILCILACTLVVIHIRWPWHKTARPSSFELIPHGPEAQMVSDILEVDSSSIRAVCTPHIHQAVPSECLVEAMAQCAALLLAENSTGDTSRSGMLVLVQSCKFEQPVIDPSEEIMATVELQSDALEGLIQFKGVCLNKEDKQIATSKFSIFIPPAGEQPE